MHVQVDPDAEDAVPPRIQAHQLVGIGGHAGKQMGFEVIAGLGAATGAQRVTIWWPGLREPTVLDNLPAGRHVIRP